MGVKVIFDYDEKVEMWEPVVHGATSETEAKQAFNAVLLTCRDNRIVVGMQHKTEVIDSFNVRIHPALKGF